MQTSRQVAAGIALTQDRPDVLMQLLQACDVSQWLEQLRMEVCRDGAVVEDPMAARYSPVS